MHSNALYAILILFAAPILAMPTPFGDLSFLDRYYPKESTHNHNQPDAPKTPPQSTYNE
ncbi:hypothetical protein FRB94_013922 [Tulasnella sp. JGI-2019a]|nr:hypothetical protein FRB93_002380 [Tulasnella sp. JGI-2019a]KAG9007866.1 hypothetical protein FRB94_013922 [Tulasnella sp. JGI-2019a]KAG9023016.1 hypothetical protein FRB95_013818 [Tulasnella sp. JGI-2019a]